MISGTTARTESPSLQPSRSSGAVSAGASSGRSSDFDSLLQALVETNAPAAGASYGGPRTGGLAGNLAGNVEGGLAVRAHTGPLVSLTGNTKVLMQPPSSARALRSSTPGAAPVKGQEVGTAPEGNAVPASGPSVDAGSATAPGRTAEPEDAKTVDTSMAGAEPDSTESAPGSSVTNKARQVAQLPLLSASRGTRAMRPGPVSSAPATPPLAVVTIPQPVELLRPVKKEDATAAGGAAGEAPGGSAPPVEPPPASVQAPAAFQIRLHGGGTDAVASVVAAPGSATATLSKDIKQPVPAAAGKAEKIPEIPVTPVSVAEPRGAAALQGNPALAATPVPPAPVHGLRADGNVQSKAPVPHPVEIAASAEVDSTPKSPAALRSVAIEFTPDGAQEVRMRLTERAGDVHISVHSTDSSLSSRLTAGVHDLVGALSSAGFEARAETSDAGLQQRRQNQDRPDEPNRPRRSAGDEGENFGSYFGPTDKENS